MLLRPRKLSKLIWSNKAPKPNAGELFGVAQTLATALPGVAWKGICTPGPHRYLPIFRMIAGLESYVRAQPGGKLPPLA